MLAPSPPAEDFVPDHSLGLDVLAGPPLAYLRDLSLHSDRVPVPSLDKGGGQRQWSLLSHSIVKLQLILLMWSFTYFLEVGCIAFESELEFRGLLHSG